MFSLQAGLPLVKRSDVVAGQAHSFLTFTKGRVSAVVP
jgi:hypothetical protein